ncbi:hypothetical protein SAMN06295879_2097 [Agreia bicolorata]|uniref:Uncharacterized protein n=1 Tax=Agreia bicolorata TaxID=110935 RepID=A0A1T4Y241_9MICO|nr:hypothetical protein SAMN06295879_2097 [Agreia bicolorata]
MATRESPRSTLVTRGIELTNPNRLQWRPQVSGNFVIIANVMFGLIGSTVAQLTWTRDLLALARDWICERRTAGDASAPTRRAPSRALFAFLPGNRRIGLA